MLRLDDKEWQQQISMPGRSGDMAFDAEMIRLITETQGGSKGKR